MREAPKYNEDVRIALILFLMCGWIASAEPQIFPLHDVKPGLRGIGRTVFQGATIEEFQVEILGVLENMGPKQSVILARLSGGPLDKTGVMQGMSGSPVFIDGKLLGAVALSFPFSKEPIAGIRPIEEMLTTSGPATPPRAVRANNPFDLASVLPPRVSLSVGPGRMEQITTPLWLSGFSRSVLDHFAPMLRSAGFEPVQGLSGGGRMPEKIGDPAALQPGSMISVQLITGDLGAGADGTVTWIEGKTIYAFGHHFMALGDTQMPFARSEVITLLANQNSSFKISSPKEWMGTITQDRDVAISGTLGRKPDLLPVSITVRSRTGVAREWHYNMNLIQDRLLSPLLLQMAVYSSLDATERTAGLSSITLKSTIELENGLAPIPFNNVYTSELAAPNMASAAIAAPISALMQSGFEHLKVSKLNLEMEVTNDKRQLQIEGLWASKNEAEPGETIELTALFTGENNQEMTKTVQYRIPLGAPAGPLYFTATDGAAANLNDYRQFLFTPPKTQPQLLSFLHGLRPNTKAFLRIWRNQPSWQVQGETLPAPPPSMALLLGNTQAQQTSSKLDELEIASSSYMMSGSKTVSVEIKP